MTINSYFALPGVGQAYQDDIVPGEPFPSAWEPSIFWLLRHDAPFRAWPVQITKNERLDLGLDVSELLTIQNKNIIFASAEPLNPKIKAEDVMVHPSGLQVKLSAEPRKVGSTGFTISLILDSGEIAPYHCPVMVSI